MHAREIRLVGLLLLVGLLPLSLYTPRAHAQTIFDPNADIFFEFGGESGELKPPYDLTGTVGSGERSGSYVRIDEEHVRSGTKSLKFYQVPPTKSDAQRRVEAQEYWVLQKEGVEQDVYVSWWVYFDSAVWDVGSASYGSWGPILGGVQAYFGPPSNIWRWMFSARWVIHSYNKQFYVGFSTWPESGDVFNSEWASQRENVFTGYYITDYLDQWIHLQTHVKITTDYSGVVEHWFNNNLVMQKTGLKINPEAYPEWNSNGCAWARGLYLVTEMYGHRDMKEGWIWVDDVVGSTTKVPETYRVGFKSHEFESARSWEDGFESGNFSAWNGTQTYGSGIRPSIITSPVYEGSYAANFSTTDGTYGSYSWAMHILQDVSEVYMRSYVRFEDLPDTNDSALWFHRMAQSDGTFIAAAGIHKVNTDYYWIIHHSDSVMNETQAMIKADTWYGVEFYFNATTNGHATLWVYDGGETKMCEMSGDYSSYGSIGIVYPYVYAGGWNGSQQTSKTLFHDDFAVDDKRIGFGTPTTFQTSTFILTGVENEPVRFSTLEGVRINGTRSTNASGCYEWANLAYNKFHTFVIEKPAGYYPAWVLNVEGSYSWNGTHYILRHNVTEKQNDPIEICFSPTEEVYIKSSTHKLTSVFYNDSSKNPHTFMRFNITADIGVTSRLEIYTADEGHPRPYKIEGATDWSYDSESKILTVWILHTGEEDAEIEWRGAAMGQ